MIQQRRRRWSLSSNATSALLSVRRLLLALAMVATPSLSFQLFLPERTRRIGSCSSTAGGGEGNPPEDSDNNGRIASTPTASRRRWLQESSSASLAAAIGAGLLSGGFLPRSAAVANADDGTLAVAEEMKDFVDPVGYFTIRVPKSFFAIRRSSKGDLPDPKTGEGRRGSSIFTAGNLQKAEVVAVERFPTKKLLEENGIEATGDLSTFPQLGEPAAVAGLINARRDRDNIANTKIIPDSLYVTSDGKELSFKLRTEIEVQRPELLLEQYGTSELFRVTVAKATLRSNDGNIMAVFASALERGKTDFIYCRC